MQLKNAPGDPCLQATPMSTFKPAISAGKNCKTRTATPGHVAHKDRFQEESKFRAHAHQSPKRASVGRAPSGHRTCYPSPAGPVILLKNSFSLNTRLL